MRKLSYIRITLLIICCLFTTHFCFAQLAVDSHIPTELTYSETIHVERNIWKEIEVPAAMVSVSIDELTFDPSSNGVANLDGSFYIHNYHPRYSLGYEGELRLEILKPQGDGTFLTLEPDAKQKVSGNLKSWNENRDNDDIIDDFSESVSLNIDCLSSADVRNIEKGDRLTMSAAITLTVRIRNNKETWAINNPTYKKDFRYFPTIDHGLGPTKNGETFSKGCRCSGGAAWDSLMITDAPFSQIYWYVKAPGDSGYGSLEDTVDGDGAERKSVFTHTFPNNDGIPETPGSYYEITAYVYRVDDSVYWKSYSVWVIDKTGK